MKFASVKKQEGKVVKAAGMAAIATVGAADGALVQIDLINNFHTPLISSLNGDLNGDSTPELLLSTDQIVLTGGVAAGAGVYFRTAATVSAIAIYASTTGIFISSPFVGTETTGGAAGTGSAYGLVTFDASGLGGEVNEEAYYFIEVDNAVGVHRISLEALIWDDAAGATRPEISAVLAGPITSVGSTENGVFTAVPEPSGLALLALGAGGIAFRRQRKKAVV